jgi:nickel-dependent lactate racemase
MLYHAQGSPDTDISAPELKEIVHAALSKLGLRSKVLAVPPDFTRANSQAGPITCLAHEFYGEKLVDVMPALGTHKPMPAWQLDKMFPGLPHGLIREHAWRKDVLTIGEVPAEYVNEVTEGIWNKPWPAQLNRLLWEGGHDLILSIGQVVPHEVIGMANYNKNIFVGTGGFLGINESHFIGAAYGMERMMGRADNPLRKILNKAEELFCQDLPVVYIQTVIGPREDGTQAMRGIYIGDDPECFFKAAELSVHVNVNLLDEEPTKVVTYLDPEEFQSTWLGNKSVYRTRMAIATGGELVVLAPAVEEFGEDPQIDALIRKYGYRTTPEVMQFVEENEDLRGNLSAAAHLIHGSSEGRFKITYAPGKLTREEIEGVGYKYADYETTAAKYDPTKLQERVLKLATNCRVGGSRRTVSLKTVRRGSPTRNAKNPAFCSVTTAQPRWVNPASAGTTHPTSNFKTRSGAFCSAIDGSEQLN